MDSHMFRRLMSAALIFALGLAAARAQQEAKPDVGRRVYDERFIDFRVTAAEVVQWCGKLIVMGASPS